MRLAFLAAALLVTFAVLTTPVEARTGTAAEAHDHVGTLLVGQGKVPEAIQHLETYLSMEPDNEQGVATATGLIEALEQ